MKHVFEFSRLWTQEVSRDHLGVWGREQAEPQFNLIWAFPRLDCMWLIFRNMSSGRVKLLSSDSINLQHIFSLAQSPREIKKRHRQRLLSFTMLEAFLCSEKEAQFHTLSLKLPWDLLMSTTRKGSLCRRVRYKKNMLHFEILCIL